jgi:cell wall-associated NlpC family hydrolase
MKRLYLLALISIVLASCGSSRTTSEEKIHKTEKVSYKKFEAKRSNIVNYAKTFEGTRYKFGGTSKNGMDCSGLVFTVFNKENVALPRISRDMAKKGKRISLSQSSEGDLVFFRTSKNRTSINHVGLVIKSQRGEILFIHSTTTKGVIISSMEENYWKKAFVEVRRVI